MMASFLLAVIYASFISLGLLGSGLGLGSYPVYLLGILLLMTWMYRRLLRIAACRNA